MTVVVMVLLPGVIALGLWQLDRGAQKRVLETAYLNKLTALPLPVAEAPLDEAFQRVVLHGEFIEQIFLVDNQVVEGVIGYWVVQGFVDKAGTKYLVNRGFVPASTSRSELPDVSAPAGMVKVIGVVWPFTGLIPVLDEDAWQPGWPKRVQRLDVARMANKTGAKAVELRLEPGQPGVTIAAPFATVLSDAQHKGYAATWFGLAVALVLSYAIFGFKSGATQLLPKDNN